MLPWTRKINFSKITLIVFAIVVVFLFFGVSIDTSFAQNTTDTLGVSNVDQSIALSGTDIRLVIVRIINTVLGLLGIIAVSLIVYAGFIIMTSGGDETKVAGGKKIIINAVIGLVVILSAFAIVKFVSSRLLAATGVNTGSENTGDAPVVHNFSGSGALGSIVRDHYPFRNQKDVARNTAVVVTFNIPVEPSTVAFNSNNSCWTTDLSGSTTTCETANGNIVNPYYGDCIFNTAGNMICDSLNTSTVKIDTNENIVKANSGVSAYVVASYDDNRDAYTFVFRPVDYLGSATENVDYTVNLLEGIRRPGTSNSVFSNFSDKKYVWNFQTGTNIDLTPPHVVNVSPSNGGLDSRNTIIQINFDEAIDPSTVEGQLNWSGSFDNILLNMNGSVVTGTWKISNGYKTVEFVPPSVCGQNSCGEVMYCLPVACVGDSCQQDFSALIRTAAPTGNPDRPFEAQPFSGVYDMSFNALDTEDSTKLIKPGIVNNKIISLSEQNPDNYDWVFKIENKIDKEAPYIESITPNIESQDVAGDAVVSLHFAKQLRSGTIHDVGIEEYPSGVCSDAAISEVPCSNGRPLDANSWWSFATVDVLNSDNTHTKVDVSHREFGPNGLDLFYFPLIPHTLQDSHQNCFYPGFGPKTSDVDCKIIYDNDGNVVSSVGCTSVTKSDANKDTSCVYGDGQTVTSTLNDCRIILKGVSLSSYVNN